MGTFLQASEANINTPGLARGGLPVSEIRAWVAANLGFRGWILDRRPFAAAHAKQVDASLSKLKIDYAGLYQRHCFDPKTPPEGTMQALTEVLQAGRRAMWVSPNGPQQALCRGWR